MISVLVNSKNGLHARPASLIVDLASKFSGEVFLIKNGMRFNSKSVMSIMSMGVLQGELIDIEAIGEGAFEIENELRKIIERTEE